MVSPPIADETTDAMEELAPDQRHEDAIDQSSVLVDVTVSTSPVALPTPQPDQKPVLEHEPAVIQPLAWVYSSVSSDAERSPRTIARCCSPSRVDSYT